MTTRLVVAYGLMALLIAFIVTVGLWGWNRSQMRADMRQRKLALKGAAERRDARERGEGGVGSGATPRSREGSGPGL